MLAKDFGLPLKKRFLIYSIEKLKLLLIKSKVLRLEKKSHSNRLDDERIFRLWKQKRSLCQLSQHLRPLFKCHYGHSKGNVPMRWSRLFINSYKTRRYPII